jgi:hypothetical protein
VGLMAVRTVADDAQVEIAAFFQKASVATSPLPTLPLALIRAETSRKTSS